MTLLAVLSDVHGDVGALRAALAQIDRLACDAIVCAGDVVDGPEPNRAVAVVREHAIPTVCGNHERWLRDDDDWHGLNEQSVAWLSGLQASWHATMDGVRVAVWHARPGNDMDGVYEDQLTPTVAATLLDQADAEVLVVGHTHEAFVHTTADGRVIANPGALAREPAGGRPAPYVMDTATGGFRRSVPSTGGTFGVLHVQSRRFVVHGIDADARQQSAVAVEHGAPGTGRP